MVEQVPLVAPPRRWNHRKPNLLGARAVRNASRWVFFSVAQVRHGWYVWAGTRRLPCWPGRYANI